MNTAQLLSIYNMEEENPQLEEGIWGDCEDLT